MKYFGSTSGLTTLAEDTSTPANGMVAYVTSSYNTGYQNGDIKLATLSDKYNASEPNVTGSELVTNGTFDTDTSGWTAGNSTISVVSGKLRISITTSGLGYAYQTINTVVGKKYTATVQGSNFGSIVNWGIRVGTSAGSDNVDAAWVTSSDTTATVTFTATSTTTYINLGVSYTAGVATDFDNISVRLAEEDRSVNGNGLQVFGTVTKSAVSSGADLVAYSGFSNTTNYLMQPYNSDLDFGTGDFCMMGWFNESSTSSTSHMIDRGDGSSDDYRFVLYRSSSSLLFRTRGNGIGTTVTQTVTSSIPTGIWTNFCIVRQNGVRYAYLNGVLQGSNADTTDLDNTSASLFVGVRMTVIEPSTADLALLRISATAPTPEQIKKIYEDEKVLFQEGAKAVLAGTSDAVTSLAYDDDQQELLVGTSQYTSVFRGLRRVEEISGSASAISASNGLRVIED